MPEEQQLIENELQIEAVREELALEEQDNAIAQQEAFEEEEEYANQLAAEQEQALAYQQEISVLDNIKQSLTSPSIFKYLLILAVFAIPNDLIDALEFTGVGLIISWLVSMFLSAGSMLVTWFADGEMQNIKAHQKNLQNYKKKAVGVLTKTASSIARFAPRSPLGKILIGTILEMIPYISIFPWASICTLLAYNDERKTYKETLKELNASYGQLSGNPVEVL
jgi:hypothetical protein